MIMDSKHAEREHLLHTAEAMAAAARTAPKTKGQDYIETLVADGEDLLRIADAMDEIFAESGTAFLHRDAECLRKTGAALLVAIGRKPRGLNALCDFCGLGGCAQCTELGASCAFDSIDLGIAVGSAVSVAEDNRVDTRVMFSVGIGAKRLGLFGEEKAIVLGIPLSVSGKSPYFDR